MKEQNCTEVHSARETEEKEPQIANPELTYLINACIVEWLGGTLQGTFFWGPITLKNVGRQENMDITRVGIERHRSHRIWS